MHWYTKWLVRIVKNTLYIISSEHSNIHVFNIRKIKVHIIIKVYIMFIKYVNININCNINYINYKKITIYIYHYYSYKNNKQYLRNNQSY